MRSLKHNLWLTGEHIGVEGAKTLSDGLKANTTLTSLNLSCDKLTKKEKEKRTEMEKMNE